MPIKATAIKSIRSLNFSNSLMIVLLTFFFHLDQLCYVCARINLTGWILDNILYVGY